MTNDFHCQLPLPLKPGDLLRVVTPSGPLRELEPFQKGVEIWRSRGYKVQLPINWDAKDGYLAGTDSQRRQQLAQAWQDPECRGILCARGGYGSARLLEDWSWFPQAQGHQSTVTLEQGGFGSRGKSIGFNGSKPVYPASSIKWLIGFSDITGLLWSLCKLGISSVHGPVLTTVATEPEWSIKRLFDCVEGHSLKPLIGKGWGKGKASGMLLPANLSVATHLLGTPVQPRLKKVILAFEDVSEAPYRLDRMLTQWRMSGAFQGVQGIALGRFSSCNPPQNVSSWSAAEVFLDRLGDLNIPIISELPFGHEGVNAALPVGQMVELDSNRGILSWMPEDKSS
ncbi:MAG: LD-carboxypeptidase [Symploca sp. SIO2E9]|nr:LD-carboxypeptidase [Symploca sp. SIO2E9]